ncbi:Theileria-specific sub-telomeric protein, SVSP family, putative [Theileria annulata]|uniref:Theileria-specific sub-telomeric protein, SVSP family, putative n=1 Tax=Theileria annulata TaxID=5874 RepID=Q4UAT1_THEAN|nr:Theileria-specific sub-telomeric protein, SVSP family, putative [Theileria annulata]CAI76070.1 Theileria-specific sub-telomeric protein, SVSP family, putative [Theileria annulata]|eukprot:XP_955546.1 Theileria-specific sub-telomeric protein, SVSP family, putative [Theileria annulata]
MKIMNIYVIFIYTFIFVILKSSNCSDQYPGYSTPDDTEDEDNNFDTVVRELESLVTEDDKTAGDTVVSDNLMQHGLGHIISQPYQPPEQPDQPTQPEPVTYPGPDQTYQPPPAQPGYPIGYEQYPQPIPHGPGYTGYGPYQPGYQHQPQYPGYDPYQQFYQPTPPQYYEPTYSQTPQQAKPPYQPTLPRPSLPLSQSEKYRQHKPDDKTVSSYGSLELIKLNKKFVFLKKDPEGNLLPMIERQDYKVIWENKNLIRYSFQNGLESIFCDNKFIYTHREKKPYCSSITYNKTNSSFVITREGGFVQIKQIKGRWIAVGRKYPDYIKLYTHDSEGKEQLLTTEHYYLDITDKCSFKYTFILGVMCTKVVIKDEVVWVKKPDNKGFPNVLSVTTRLNLVLYFPRSRIVYSKMNNRYIQLYDEQY